MGSLEPSLAKLMMASHRSDSQGQWAPGTDHKQRELSPVVTGAAGTAGWGSAGIKWQR